MSAAAIRLPEESTVESPGISDVRVLIVGPDEQDHLVLRCILEPDCEVYCATGCRAGAVLFRRYHPRVVICDQKLPDGDWRDLLADLRMESQTLPLIVASQQADDGLWEDVLRLGGHDLLLKPFVRLEVSHVVMTAARQKSA